MANVQLPFDPNTVEPRNLITTVDPGDYLLDVTKATVSSNEYGDSLVFNFKVASAMPAHIQWDGAILPTIFIQIPERTVEDVSNDHRMSAEKAEKLIKQIEMRQGEIAGLMRATDHPMTNELNIDHFKGYRIMARVGVDESWTGNDGKTRPARQSIRSYHNPCEWRGPAAKTVAQKLAKPTKPITAPNANQTALPLPGATAAGPVATPRTMASTTPLPNANAGGKDDEFADLGL